MAYLLVAKTHPHFSNAVTIRSCKLSRLYSASTQLLIRDRYGGKEEEEDFGELDTLAIRGLHEAVNQLANVSAGGRVNPSLFAALKPVLDDTALLLINQHEAGDYWRDGCRREFVTHHTCGSGTLVRAFVAFWGPVL